ncbi:NAD(P)/FAD-dependent oxidoreductase [Catalinimonas niigatensis]|uniref:NAD(P)/FAD-dependent oxidoreductase n=1 Tax=Catalinimonas niigatensis TaxID=1397264 RepID=UPI002667025D|nr:geranylgeranyl reductase family protein [Catalinimonas niigatensis]WPP49245.1 geranylgeranyl reductase family protein [Catalinimonas niigatensis]
MNTTKHDDFDVIIVGAGPAGCICALQLAGKGLKIALIERAVFPRDKICGDALSPDVINQLKLIDVSLSQGFLQSVRKKDVNSIRFVAPNYKHLDFHFTNPNHPASAGYIAKRLDFDNFLFNQIKGLGDITIFEDHQVEQLENLENEVLVRTDKRRFSASIVVGADGAQSVVNRQLTNNKVDRDHYCAGVRQYFEGIDELHQTDCIELHFYKELLPGYFWIFSLPNGQANVGIGMLSSEVSRQKINLKEKLTDIIQHHLHVKHRFKDAKPLEAIQGFGLPIGSRKVACSGHRFLLLGDAASLIDPFTGEGIGNAIRSGRIAADHLLKAFEQKRFDADFNIRYDREIYRRMWTELRVSRSMQKMLKYPGIFNFLVNKAQKNESVRTLLTSMLNNTDLRKELRKPSFYTKLIFK